MRIPVELGERSYEVVVGDGVSAELDAVIAPHVSGTRTVVVVTTEALRAFEWHGLSSSHRILEIVVPDGEAAKSLHVLEEVCEQLSRANVSRHDVIVGYGGGAVTDLAGFVAASYLRGIGLVQVPTSLVGQVDAAIGGKTGVNLATGKNLVGAFYQPWAVLCDSRPLATLPEREVRNGLGEVAKCALLRRRHAHELDAVGEAELRHDAIALKAEVVSGDEREGGRRALLNYGHTLAHAIEAVALEGGDLDIRHGEAVAIGLNFASRLARRLGRVGDESVANHEATLAHFGLAGSLPRGLSVDFLMDAMLRDKKADHNLTFVLDGPRGPEVVPGVASEAVRDELVAFGGEL